MLRQEKSACRICGVDVGQPPGSLVVYLHEGVNL